MTYEAETTDLKSPASDGCAPVVPKQVSPRRRRTIKNAVALLTQARLSPAERRHAILRVRVAAQPNVEAKRIIRQNRQRALEGMSSGDVDLSDIRELRVKLVRRDAGLWPPQSTILATMERQIAQWGMTRSDFKAAAAALMAMPQALPKSFREAESNHRGFGE